MRVIILETEQEVAHFGANTIAKQINNKPDSVLGLATGTTPIKTYQQLIVKYQSDTVSFKDVSSFNLDEYIGLPEHHPQSYRYFMDQHLFNHIDIDPANTHIPSSTHITDYETCIEKAGGIDLQLLGIGSNGHIGFNEPGSSLGSKTRIKTLNAETMKSNSRFFADNELQPTLSVTMGIATIMRAKKILLLATGTNKIEAIANAIEGPVTAFCPASILQMHPQVSIVIDQEASRGLKLKKYYCHAESNQSNLD